MTLEKVIIDAERSFAPGQVYVALSRAVSLDGLYLKSGISGRNIIIDSRIVEYSAQNAPVEELPGLLESEKRQHAKEKLLQKFEFELLRTYTSAWYYKLERKYGEKLPPEIKEIQHVYIAKTNELERIMLKFRNEIRQIFEQNGSIVEMEAELFNRGKKAIAYCISQVDDFLLKKCYSFTQIFNQRSKSKRWSSALEELAAATLNKREQLLQLKYLNQPLHPEMVSPPVLEKGSVSLSETSNDNDAIGLTPTLQVTLDMWQTVRNIAMISENRKLAKSTVETHLSKLVQLGLIEAKEFITAEKLEEIINLGVDWALSLSEIRSQNESFSYFELKMAKIILNVPNE